MLFDLARDLNKSEYQVVLDFFHLAVKMKPSERFTQKERLFFNKNKPWDTSSSDIHMTKKSYFGFGRRLNQRQ
jgi:hypothetical protein